MMRWARLGDTLSLRRPMLPINQNRVSMRLFTSSGPSSAPPPVEPSTLISHQGHSTIVTLNRPKALNSLNLEMVRTLIPLYKEWNKNKNITNVILRGTGKKAFCAGGDIVQIYHSGKGAGTAHQVFFAEEYSLDYLIATLKAPHISFLDGVTMGGGVGLSVHSPFRVATENTLFAMPETAIGFFPDVGGSYFLPRLGGSLGTFLGLTGYRLKGEDTVIAGIATHFVPSDALEELQGALSQIKTRDSYAVAATISRFTKPIDLAKSKIIQERALIASVFSLPSVEAIFSALSQDKSEFSQELFKLLQLMSPTSLKVTLRLLQKGATMNLADCLKLEYHVSQVFMKNKDFYEGVRAQLIDKDKSPKWSPSSVSDVKDEDIERYFQYSSLMTLESHEEEAKL